MFRTLSGKNENWFEKLGVREIGGIITVFDCVKQNQAKRLFVGVVTRFEKLGHIYSNYLFYICVTRTLGRPHLYVFVEAFSPIVHTTPIERLRIGIAKVKVMRRNAV